MPSTTLFTGNEEHDFCESVAEWFDWQHGVERWEGDEVVKRLWKEREKEKVEYWLQYGAVPGTEVWERKGVGKGARLEDCEVGVPEERNRQAFAVNLAKLGDEDKRRVFVEVATVSFPFWPLSLLERAV